MELVGKAMPAVAEAGIEAEEVDIRALMMLEPTVQDMEDKVQGVIRIIRLITMMDLLGIIIRRDMSELFRLWVVVRVLGGAMKVDYLTGIDLGRALGISRYWMIPICFSCTTLQPFQGT